MPENKSQLTSSQKDAINGVLGAAMQDLAQHTMSEEAYIDFLCTEVSKKVRRELAEESVQASREAILASRLSYLLRWYHQKAQRNRQRYNLFRTLSIVLPCLITLCSVYTFLMGDKAAAVASATISILITFCSHHMEQFRYYENWMRYRGTAERLKHDTLLYLNDLAPYAQLAPDGSQVVPNTPTMQFAQDIETTAMDELAKWESLQQEIRNTPSSSGSSGGNS